MTYPRVITPDTHQLKQYYKRLSALVLLSIPALFLVNEFLFREHLAMYQNSLDSSISLFLLLLNGVLPHAELPSLRNLLLGISIAFAGIACLLPKWTLGPQGQILRSNQPFDLGELALAQFRVKS